MKTNSYYWGILLACALIGSTSCEIINPEEEIPAFVYIDNFDLTTSVGEGSASRKITEVFVFGGSDFIGIYSLPADFPILKTGSQQLQIFPGVQDNGVAATPELYPFYGSYTTTVDLVPQETDTLRPTIEYIDDIKFTIQETFENNLQVFREDLDEDPITEIEFTTDASEVFEGQQSAKIVVTEQNPRFQVASIRFNELPVTNRNVYIELNYRNEVPIEIGVLYTDEFNQTLSDYRNILNVSPQWNKIYLNLTEQFNVLATLPDIRDFQIGIRVTMPIDQNGVFATGSRTVLLDNIKFIHF